MTKAAISVLLAIINASFVSGQGNQSSINNPIWNWRIFGDGFSGGSARKENSETFIDANWLKASWGVGISYSMQWSEKNPGLDRVRVEIKSLAASDSKAKVYAGSFTQSDGNKVQDPSLALPITNEWQTFELTNASMTSNSSERFSPPTYTPESNNTQIVNFYFIKPKNSQLASETIVLRNLIITFKNGESYVYEWPY